MKITLTFEKEDDNRWTARCPELDMAITRDSLEEARWAIWEWMAEQLLSAGKEWPQGTEDVIEEVAGLDLRNRLEDPWGGRRTEGVERYISVDSVVEAIQWNGQNTKQIERFLRMRQNLMLCLTADPLIIIIEDGAGKRAALRVGDWVVRLPGNEFGLRYDEKFRKTFVPLPDSPQRVRGEVRS